MPSRRDQIKMTDDELWKFIEERKSLQVATIGADGAPHLTTLWFAIVDGEIAFETFTKSQKILNLRRDGRISVLVEDGDAYEKLRGVEIVGRGEVVDDKGVLKEVASSVVARYMGVSEAEADAAAEILMNKRSAVVIHAERIVSWDHSKLGGTY